MTNLEWCKNRAKECNFEIKEDANWNEFGVEKWLFGKGTFVPLINLLQDKETQFTVKAEGENNKIIEIKIIIKYDPTADFEYFTHERYRSDGTLLYLVDQQTQILRRICTLGTYNKEKASEEKLRNLLPNQAVQYTIGNFVTVVEYSEDFATEEKPWLLERDTTMLPIKFDIVDLE